MRSPLNYILLSSTKIIACTPTEESISDDDFYNKCQDLMNRVPKQDIIVFLGDPNTKLAMIDKAQKIHTNQGLDKYYKRQ